MEGDKGETGGKEDGRYGLRSAANSKGKEPVDKEERGKKNEVAPARRRSRSLNRKPKDGRKRRGKNSTPNGVSKTLEELWKLDNKKVGENGKGTIMDEAGSESGEEENEKKRKEQSDSEDEDEAERVREQEREKEAREIAFQSRQKLLRTPPGGRSGMSEGDGSLDGELFDLSPPLMTTEEQTGTEKDYMSEEEQESQRSKKRDESGRGSAAMERQGETMVDKLEEWMREWGRKQKEEWEMRMKDIETMIRSEMRSGVENIVSFEDRDREMNKLGEDLDEVQVKCNEYEVTTEELRAESRQWRTVAEEWREEAERLKRREQKVTDGTEENRNCETNDARNTQRRNSAPEFPSERGDDPGTWRNNPGRVEGPGSMGEPQELQGGETGSVNAGDGSELEDTNGKEVDDVTSGEDRRRGGRERKRSVLLIPNPSPRALTQEEWADELEDRRLRRKNIIIEGLTLLSRKRKEELEEWLLNNLEIRARVERLDRLEGVKWLARLEELSTKKEIMKKKTRLKGWGWGVFVRDDLTVKQKEVKSWLENEAENWRRSGKQAGVSYNSICVDGVWLEWDERKGELRQKENRGKEERPF